jgi:8-oxo-dGTP pyrophosphatase MutT (NUDIX family)
MNTPPPPIDAATVVVGRDTSDGVEVLMLKKNSKIYFGGMWVFPGGRVDEEDRDAEAHVTDTHLGAPLTGFRTAAVREAREEAGIDLSGSELHHFSHWLPPPIRPKRFSTHFFLTRAPHDIADVSIDHGEITEHAWINPTKALERRAAGEIEVVTPTFVTLDWLRRHDSLDDLIGSIEQPQSFHTRIRPLEGSDPGNIAFYHGDVGYESMDPDIPGPRRRCYMLSSAWWWEEHDGEGNGPAPPPR